MSTYVLAALVAPVGPGCAVGLYGFILGTSVEGPSAGAALGWLFAMVAWALLATPLLAIVLCLGGAA